MLDPSLRDVFPGRPEGRAERLRDRPAGPAVLDGSVRASLSAQLRAYLSERAVLGYCCVVVGMSGGVDSAVCAQLAIDAAPGDVRAVVVDLGDAPEDTDRGRAQADALSVPCTVLPAKDLLVASQQLVAGLPAIGRVHLRSRLISLGIFQVADASDGLVIDTTDRSELILRLYEEGCRGHVAPIVDLFKSEVYALADAMGLGTFARSGCPGLNNEDAFGLPWSQLDFFLEALASGATLAELEEATGMDRLWLERLARRVRLQPLRTELVELRIGTPGSDPGRDAERSSVAALDPPSAE